MGIKNCICIVFGGSYSLNSCAVSASAMEKFWIPPYYQGLFAFHGDTDGPFGPKKLGQEDQRVVFATNTI